GACSARSPSGGQRLAPARASRSGGYPIRSAPSGLQRNEIGHRRCAPPPVRSEYARRRARRGLGRSHAWVNEPSTLEDGMSTGLRSLPWRDPGFTAFFLAASLGPVCSMALRFVPGHLARMGAAPALVGDVMAVSTLGGVLALPVAGVLTTRRPRAVLVVGAVLQAAGLWLAGLPGQPVGVLAFAVGLMSTGT